MHVSFQISVFISCRYIPRYGIAGSHGSFTSRFWRNLRTVFHRGCANLYPHQHCPKAPCFPHPCPHFLSLFFFFFLSNLILSIYLFIGCVGSSLLCVGSLAVASRGYFSLQCAGFSLQWLLLLQSTGSRHTGFNSCSMWAQQLWLSGSRAQDQ